MPPTKNSLGAIFDVKPVDDTGLVDVKKIETVQPVINLSSYRQRKAPEKNLAVNEPIPIKRSDRREKKFTAPKKEIKDDFESVLNDLNVDVELARIGGQPADAGSAKPRYRIIQKKSLPDSIHAISDSRLRAIATEVQQSALARYESLEEPSVPGELNPFVEIPQAAPRVQLEEFLPKKVFTMPIISRPVRKVSAYSFKFPWKWFVAALLAIAGIWGLAYYAIGLKHRVISESSSAVSNLQNAKDALKSLNIQGASQDFVSAYKNFSDASSNLNVMGQAITSLVGALPGGQQVQSANNLIKAGQLLANAGSAMTDAMGAVSKSGVILDPTNTSVPIGNIVTALQKALSISKGDLTQASALFANVDESIIPVDQKDNFDTFKAELPSFASEIKEGADYAQFFENMIGTSGTKKYLLLFENSAELRPTGGFPGSYAVVTFTDGKMQSFFVDDIYNLDGQIKENIIPPLQLQAITPTWGMRDSAWYVDFPTSARNVESFYTKETQGQSVDGVITINPQLIADLLKITGPISMPQYNLTLTSDNILTTIQDQVEYGPNRAQPKQILKDFAPLLLQKIYSASSDQWLSMFNDIVTSMDQHQILTFFNDLNMESFASSRMLTGQVQNPVGDYVMPVITNVKGSKTDAVTDTTFALTTSFSGSDALHTLTISRTHNGGHDQFGFYNKQNPAYVRVLVPDGAELVSVDGNDKPDYQPLVAYGPGFERDDELTAFETSGQTNTNTGVTTYRESGKTEFGFWLITNPGQTKTVSVAYRVPSMLDNGTYNLYVQKQPGLVVKDFSFSLDPSGQTPVASAPLLIQNGSSYTYSAPLDNDLPIKVNFQ